MRKLCVSVVTVVLVSIAAQAQDKPPVVEIYGGYLYLNFDLALDPVTRPGRQNANGVGLNVAGNFNNWFGVVGDFSYNTKDVAIPEFGGLKAAARNLYFLAGPRLSMRRERTTLFAQALAGVGHTRVDIGGVPKFTDLAFGLGGGLDINANKRIAIRAFQFDYLPSRTTNDFTKDKVWLHNIRAQVGIVLKLGN
jgi:hypothetical protein